VAGFSTGNQLGHVQKVGRIMDRKVLGSKKLTELKKQVARRDESHKLREIRSRGYGNYEIEILLMFVQIRLLMRAL
jgi:hypothetical protein